MKVHGEIDLSGIKKIVINQTIVWQREEQGGNFIWIKTAGGKGYDATCPLVYHPHELMASINHILARPKKKMLPCGDVVVIGNAYHAWPAGETLNVCRKED